MRVIYRFHSIGTKIAMQKYMVRYRDAYKILINVPGEFVLTVYTVEIAMLTVYTVEIAMLTVYTVEIAMLTVYTVEIARIQKALLVEGPNLTCTDIKPTLLKIAGSNRY